MSETATTIDEAMMAARAALRGATGDSSTLHVWNKKVAVPGNTIVTTADVLIERAVIEAIRSRQPAVPIAAEESAAGVDPRAHELCFVVDPLDGTQEFAAGRPDFSISIAATLRGRVSDASVFFPSYGTELRVRAETAFLNGVVAADLTPPSRRRLRIAASPRQLDDDRIRALETEVDAEIFPVPAFTPKLRAIALREVDCAIYLPSPQGVVYVWDYAGAARFIELIGGGFYGLSGENLLEKLPLAHYEGWFAGHAETFAALRDLIGTVAV